MSAWLIELSFGPVQGFIAAARNSRDLWTGSRLLSGVARAAGQSLLDAGAELIYPVPSRVRGDKPEENSNLSNVLLACVEADTEAAVARMAQAAQQAARTWLQEQADHAFQVWTDKGVALRKGIWQRQVENTLESFGVWSRIDDDYRAAYDRTKAALGARKNTRDFAPMFAPGQPQLGFGIPKSSLDGVHESVLPENRKRFPRRFHVSPGEQLDAMGCIKRVADRSERFTALTRLAADSWLAVLDDAERRVLCAAYEELVPLDYATRAMGNDSAYVAFPYDAGLLYPERLESALREAKEDSDRDAEACLARVRDTLRPLWRRHGLPCPYATIMVADGDRMGAFIDRAQSREHHSAISAAIAAFADAVPAAVRAHGGHCIYNGGEDVMALLPLGGVIEGSRALAQAFDARMQGVVRQLLGDHAKTEDIPSLRVGVAICHVQEPLGLIRRHGDDAEKFAKGIAGTDRQGNALGLQLHVRAGHVVPWRARFDEPDEFDQLQAWRNAYAEGRLPGKLAYRIRQAWMAGHRAGLDGEVIDCEVRRALLQATRSGGGEALDANLAGQLQARATSLRSTGDPTGHGKLVDELILARWLSARSANELGRGDA